MAHTAKAIPVFYCSNPLVQDFIDDEAWDLRPYCPQPPVKTAEEVFAAARSRFGDLACYDLTIYQH
jgi:hypothetical protein